MTAVSQTPPVWALHSVESVHVNCCGVDDEQLATDVSASPATVHPN
jgi:hypothetical protein